MVNDLVFYCGQTAGCIKIPVGMDVCLSPGDFVLDGDPVPPQKGGGAPPPNFRPMFIEAKRRDGSRWHLAWGRPWSSPHCARWGHSSPPPKGDRPPIFDPSLLWPTGCMHQDATWYGGRPQPRRLCVRFGPSSLPQKGRSPTQFSAHVYFAAVTRWYFKMCFVFLVKQHATPKCMKRRNFRVSYFLRQVHCAEAL